MGDWPLLGALGDDDRRRVLATARRRRFARREVLFHEGDPGDTLHLVDRGRVAVRVTTPLGDTATLIVVGAGAVLGELALVEGGGGRRSATAVALEKTETLSLHRDDFDALRREHPAVERLLVEALAATVRRTSEHLLDALYVPAEKRVARRLLDLVDVYRTNGTDTPVPIVVTQDDIASLAGTSRATANRVLGELEERGALTVSRGCVTVLDVERVARHAR